MVGRLPLVLCGHQQRLFGLHKGRTVRSTSTVCHHRCRAELHATCNVDSQQASPTQSFPVLTNGVGKAAFWPNHNAAATTIMVHNIPWLPVEQDKRMNHTLRVHQICIRVWTERRHHVSIIVWSACPWSSAATSSVSSDCTKGARYGQQAQDYRCKEHPAVLRYFNYTHTDAAQNATTATRNSIDFNAPTTHHRNT